MCLPAKKRVFELGHSPKNEEDEEDSGRRSILGLGGIGPPIPAPASTGPAPDSSGWRPAGAAAQAPEGEEEPETGSLLGLDRMVLSAEWKAAVAANTPPSSAADRVQTGPARRAARVEEEDPGDFGWLRLERSEFALRSKSAPAALEPLASASAAAKAAPAASRPGAARDPLLARDLLFLRDRTDPDEIDPPHFERDLEPPSVTPIPVERAILLSLLAHIALLLLLLWMPTGSSSGRHGLLAQLIPESKPEDKIPIVFRSAPGPERENPKRSEPSDKTRRAGGGDRSKPRADTPFVPQRPGIADLTPGGRTGASAPAPPPRPAADAGPRTAAGASSEAAKSASDGFRVPPPGAASSGQGSQIADMQRAIRDAAREVGSQGLGGAGTANPDGGFVDSGPISFDTSWYDWGAYAEEMVRRIKLHWDVPELARLGWKGKLTVRFYILADGRVEGAVYLSHSGTPPFDFSAMNAILKSNPFKPLPKDLLAQIPGKDREGVTVTFFYNIRPEKE